MPEPYSSFPDSWPSFPQRSDPGSAPRHPEPLLDNLPGPSLASLLLRWAVFLGVLVTAVIFVWNAFFDQVSEEEEGMESSDIIIETPSSKIIGPKGGEVSLYDGASVIVPEGALDRDMLISIEKIRQGDITDLYHLKPDYLKFILPVIVSLPYDREPYRLYTGESETNLSSPNKTTIDRQKRLAITKLSEF